MTTKRTAVIAGGVAAGAWSRAPSVVRSCIADASTSSSTCSGTLPPDDLGPVASFDGTELAVRAAGDRRRPRSCCFVHGFSLDMTTWREQWLDLSVRLPVRADGPARPRARAGEPAHGDLSLRSMGRDVAAVLEAVAPDRPGRARRAHAWARWRSSRSPSSVRSCSDLASPASSLIGASSSDLLARRDGLDHRPRAPAPGLARPRPHAASTGCAAPSSRARPTCGAPSSALTQFGPDAPQHVVDHVVASRRARVVRRLDRRPRRADGDGHAARRAARPGARARGGGRARPRDAAGRGDRARGGAPRGPARRDRGRGPHPDARAPARAEPRDPWRSPARCCCPRPTRRPAAATAARKPAKRGEAAA